MVMKEELHPIIAKDHVWDGVVFSDVLGGFVEGVDLFLGVAASGDSNGFATQLPRGCLPLCTQPGT